MNWELNVNKEEEIIKRLEFIEFSIVEIIQRKDERMKLLEQENEDLKGQLRQFGLDLANKGEKKGLFLKWEFVIDVVKK